jgi:hypothetical protein
LLLSLSRRSLIGDVSVTIALATTGVARACWITNAATKNMSTPTQESTAMPPGLVKNSTAADLLVDTPSDVTPRKSPRPLLLLLLGVDEPIAAPVALVVGATMPVLPSVEAVEELEIPAEALSVLPWEAVLLLLLLLLLPLDALLLLLLLLPLLLDDTPLYFGQVCVLQGWTPEVGPHATPPSDAFTSVSLVRV